MRRTQPPGELARLAVPLWPVADWAWQHMHWWVVVMLLLYAISGITVVDPDEIALVVRWGRLVGRNPGEQVHGPGPLVALPPPIDEVIRIKVQKVYELPVSTLAPPEARTNAAGNRLDPVAVGYALTGDQNIVHSRSVVRFQIEDPGAFLFAAPNPSTVLRVAVSSAMVRSLGEMPVDSVLSDGRKQLVSTATARAQACLDGATSGLRISSLELVGLAPPFAVAREFDAVQSAYIEAETAKKNALAYEQEVIPAAQAQSNAALQSARADAAAALGKANGAAAAFTALEREYRGNPVVVRERLYRDALEQAIGSAGSVRWIPPPAKRKYRGLRIMLSNSVPAAAQGRTLQ